MATLTRARAERSAERAIVADALASLEATRHQFANAIQAAYGAIYLADSSAAADAFQSTMEDAMHDTIDARIDELRGKVDDLAPLPRAP